VPDKKNNILNEEERSEVQSDAFERFTAEDPEEETAQKVSADAIANKDEYIDEP
jgi:hypothetical protein